MLCNICGSNKIKYKFTKNDYKLYQCDGCSFVFVHPYPNNEMLDRYYQESYESGKYEIYATAMDIRRKINEQRFSDIQKFNPGGKIFDIGCGVGYFLNVAQEHNLETYGVEFTEEGTKISKIKHKNVYKGTLDENTFSDSFFDVVSIFDVIEHIIKPMNTFKEISRIIKRDGILAITTPDISSWHAKFFRKNWGVIIPPEHINYFSPTSLEIALKICGFKILEIRKNYKIFTWEYLLKNSKYFFPHIYPISKILLKILPSRFLKKYRKFFIGELFAVARKK